MQQRGHDLNVVSILTSQTATESSIEQLDAKGVAVYQIVLPSTSNDLNHPYELQPVFLKILSQVLSEIKPDLVHANGWKYTSAQVCHELNIPCVITAHHGGIVCPSGALLNQHDTICTIAASMDNCLKCALHFVPGGDFWSPIIQQLPVAFSRSLAKSLINIRNIPYTSPAFQTPLRISHKLEQIHVLQKAPDCIIAPSHAIATALIRNGIPADKVTVISHGIFPLEKKPLDTFIPKRPLHLGYLGRISYVKGLHILIDALNLLPNTSSYELNVYGDAVSKDENYYLQTLKEKSQSLPVIWHGKISNDKIQDAYHSFDIMIHPTICLEVFGLTLLESLSSGRPVIATRCGGPEDFIQEGIDGILVEPNDAESLANALKKCINNPGDVQNLSSTIRPINTLESHLSSLEDLYKKLQG
jgi:glycosyltransferase involved in cell wall biosynthesis